MGIAWIGEFLGTAYASYSTTKTKLDIADKSKDFWPDETKLFIMKSLGDCAPASDHLTKLGRFKTRLNLQRNDYFGSLLSIDSSTQSASRRGICIFALKTAAKCICYGSDVELLRGVTYSYLAVKYVERII